MPRTGRLPAVKIADVEFKIFFYYFPSFCVQSVKYVIISLARVVHVVYREDERHAELAGKRQATTTQAGAAARGQAQWKDGSSP